MEELEKRLGYKFNNSGLLMNAMTHSSAVNELKTASNQRLEFLGDSVLQLIISSYIYKKLPKQNEGALSKLRSLVVCSDSLLSAANDIDLNKYIILGKGEELSGGRDKKNIIADAFESLIGAIYLDGGYHTAENFVLKTLMNVIDKAIKGTLTYDFKTTLQEYAQSLEDTELSYELLRTEGPEHEQIFYSRVVLGNRVFRESCGRNRKQSEQNAAENALRELKIID